MHYALRIIHKIDAGWLIAAALTLFASQALLTPGLPTSADLTIHLYRALEFERAWAPGVVVPRWAPNLAYGYGYPLFLFAPPLPYAVAMVFGLAGLTVETAFKLLIIFTFLLYAIGMYLLARDLLGSPAAGLVAATAYALAPFALREGLLGGGNVPQLLAIGLFPWPLWAATRAARTGRWGWTVLAGIFYTAVVLSHLFQVFVFSPVFGAYILLLVFLQLKNNSKKSNTHPTSHIPHLTSHIPHLTSHIPHLTSHIPHLTSHLRPLLAPIIGLLLSTFFWLPAFIERYHTRAQSDIYLEKSPFFVRYPHWSELLAWIQPLDARAANPNQPLTLGVVTLVLAGLGVLLILAHYASRITRHVSPVTHHSSLITRHSSLPLIFFTLVAAGAAFMSLAVSKPVWELVAILQVAEFPWRMLGLANLGLALLAGAAILWLSPKLRLPAAAICIVIQLGAVAPFLYPVIPFARHGQPTIAEQIKYERSSQSIGTTTLGEYLPQSVKTSPSTSPLAEAFEAGTFPERLDRSSLPADATATLLEQTAVTHRYQLSSPTPFTLRLFHFDFPGWQAQLNGRPVQISPEPETGLMLIDVPAGQHTLTIHFGETPVRVVAMGVSGLTVVGLVGVAIAKRRRQRSAVGGQRSVAGNPQSPISNYQLPITRLPLTQPAILLSLTFTIAAALWLKPLLRPVFTLNSPRDDVLPAQHHVDIHFADGIQLVGYNLSRRVAPPGGYVQVVLYWQTNAAPHRANLQPFVHLDRLDDFTTVAGTTNYTPGDVTTETNMPTFHWDNLRYVRDEHDLVIPPGTPPLAYAVRVGLINPDRSGQLVPLADGSGDTAQIDIINVSPGGSQPAPLAHSPDVLFNSNGDSIRLVGFEMDAPSPERLDFTLAWRSSRQPKNNYTVFAQLLDSSQNLVTSFDRPPLDGAYPTATWLPNQTIIDPRRLPLAGVPPGEYTLIAGLYDSATGQRMVTAEGADFIELSTITVKELGP